jgi:dCTP diphosphatase
MSGVSLEEITKRVRQFADAREWQKFHTPRNLLLALVGEVGELAAEFQWMADEAARPELIPKEGLARIAAEVADIQIYLIRLADVLDIDIFSEVVNKLELNESRYPESLARGNSTKYTEFENPREKD